MKKKVIRYTENDIERLVGRIIKEDLPRRERERHQTHFAKSKFEPYDRERDIMDAFGPYKDDVPVNVISYLRKNPRTFLKKLVDVYGMDKFLDFIGYTPNEDNYDNHMEEDYMCETCGGDHMKEEWPEKLKKGRFTSYCKRQGYEGANKECANKAMDSDDPSVRGMASFYLNTVKP
jgi:hypothetical protein